MTKEEMEKCYGTDTTILAFKPICKLCGYVFEDIDVELKEPPPGLMGMTRITPPHSVLFTPFSCPSCKNRIVSVECKTKYLEFFK